MYQPHLINVLMTRGLWRGIKKYARVVVAAVIAYYTAGAVNTWMIGPICVPVGSSSYMEIEYRDQH
jgi:hypothetical protein